MTANNFSTRMTRIEQIITEWWNANDANDTNDREYLV